MKPIVALSGAAGFVGRKLASKLVELDYSVIALDLIDPEIEKVQFHHFDIRNESDVSKIELPRESIFVHLAAMSTDPICKENPVDAVNVNLTGTSRIIELVNKNACSKLIFASSEWVYPEKQDSEPQTETELLSLEQLNSLYAMTKLMGENIVRTTCQIPNISLRFGIVYGPRTKPGSAPESIAFKISQGEDVTLGAGNTARRFIYVEDLVEGITRAIMQSAPINSSVYNLSGDELISLMQIAETAMDISGQQVQVIDGGGIASIRNPSPNKFMSDFGFTSKVSLSAGLKSCLEVMK